MIMAAGLLYICIFIFHLSLSTHTLLSWDMFSLCVILQSTCDHSIWASYKTQWNEMEVGCHWAAHTSAALKEFGKALDNMQLTSLFNSWF